MALAVALYRESRPVNVVPVDLNKPRDEFFRNSKEMFNKVERRSREYRPLMDQNSLDTQDHGFPFLNGDRCAQAWAAIYDEESHQVGHGWIVGRIDHEAPTLLDRDEIRVAEFLHVEGQRRGFRANGVPDQRRFTAGWIVLNGESSLAERDCRPNREDRGPPGATFSYGGFHRPVTRAR